MRSKGGFVKKLTVFAMTEKGYAVVRLLLTRYPGLVASVISSRDKEIAEDFYSEIATLCQSRNVSFHDRADASPIRTKHALAVAWRWLIDGRSANLIVFHDSLLPHYRGFNPLVTALINGDTKIGVTALHAATQYDRGDIVAQSSSSISYPIKIKEAIKIVLKNYETLAAEIGESLSRGRELSVRKQNEAEASYSLWRDDEDYFIDWSQSAGDIKRFVDAVGHPYKGAAATVDRQVVRIRDAEALRDVHIANRTAGKVIFHEGDKPVVVCGHGLLRIIDLIDDQTGASLLPLPRFRIRFKGIRR